MRPHRGQAADDDEAGALDRSALRWFGELVRPYRLRLVIACVAVVLSGGVSLGFPWVAGKVVNAAILEKSMEHVEKVILVLLGLFALSSGLDYTETYFLRRTAADMLQGLRTRLHAHLLTLTPSFFEAQRTGELLSRLSSDVEQIGGALTDQLVGGLQQVFVLIGALAILLGFHAGLTGVMLLAVPPVIVAAVLFGRRLRKLSKAEREALADANVVAEESLAGVRTVQAFAREEHERQRFALGITRATETALRAAKAWGAFRGVIRFLAFSAITLVLLYGGKLLVGGALSPGDLTAFLMYTLTVAGAIGSLTALYGSFRSVAGATERVRQLLATKPAIEDPADPVPLTRVNGAITLRDVTFAYPSHLEKKALDRVSLEVAPGECVALVGPSGAGKTTLVSLLLRFHDPQAGEVAIDGVSVRRYRLRDLREAIGLVPQDIMLFAASVAENIRYGRPSATDAEVRAAADAAQAHAFIEKLPQGYASLVGERGVKLSGGERQRIAIARVLLKDPRVVVLDEATSSLDSESEHLIQLAFDRLLTGRTTIVIAHRLTTVRRASRVVLLEDGAVRESGTHDELLTRNGLYRRLVELQMLGGPVERAQAPG
ncbi:MAG TPA: ABC transporter transmembrane domain-containing protein [Planctomycetota bacterium]|nr:ABC transporter transmembrane domain-containing protein [Planctomycetota bacterium]